MLIAGNSVSKPFMVLSHKEVLQVLRKQLEEIYLVSVLSFLFTWTHVSYHECLLGDSHPQTARLCWAALSWRQMPCSYIWESFRKCQICYGEVDIEQGLSRKAWRKKHVKQCSSRAARDLHLRLGIGTEYQSPRKRMDFTTVWMLPHTLHN